MKSHFKTYINRALSLFLFLFCIKEIACANVLQSAGDTSSFMYMADPTMYYSNGKYYLYGTYDLDNSQGIRVFVSDNFKTFSSKESYLALKKGDAYGTANFWAPQVWKHNGKLYMAYVANGHIAIAEADNLTGPFKGNDRPLIEDKKTIDPYIFKDDDGNIYLFHVEFDNGNKIYVAQLKNDLSGIYPGTDLLCLSAQSDWETQMANVVEGPTVLKHNGWYYLIYSANHFKSEYYAVGYAVSKNVYGPWQKSDANPVLSIAGTGKSGTGHGDIFFDKNGKMYYVFHTHNSDTKISPRKTAVARIYFKSDKKGTPDKLIINQKNMQYIQLNN